jgi:N utilization substance protein B
MPSRHRSRERALQILYQWDLRQPRPARGETQPSQTESGPFTIADAIESYFSPLTGEDGRPPDEPDEFAGELAGGVALKCDEIDSRILEHSQHWRLERMPAVDRNILRLAIYEMIYVATPAPVVIHEALELAQRFSTSESPGFINGVLDAVRRAGEAHDQAGG